MKKTLWILLAICTLLPAAGFAQGIDLTDAKAVRALFLDPTEDAPAQWYCGPSVPPEDCGPDQPIEVQYTCWIYTGGDYYLAPEQCGASSNGCITSAKQDEQACVNSAYTACGNANNTNGSCFKDRTDDCRRAFCSHIRLTCKVNYYPGCA